MEKVGIRAEAQHSARRRLRIRPAYIVLALVMAFFAFKFVEKTKELQQLNREAAALRAANQLTMSQTGELKQQIRYYKTQNYVLNRARALWGYLPADDRNIVPSVRYQTGAAVRAAPRIYVPPPPTWRQWWTSFFG